MLLGSRKIFFLDKLPRDIATLIATNLCNGKLSSDALSLAQASFAQRLAVREALSSSLRLTGNNKETSSNPEETGDDEGFEVSPQGSGQDARRISSLTSPLTDLFPTQLNAEQPVCCDQWLELFGHRMKHVELHDVDSANFLHRLQYCVASTVLQSLEIHTNKHITTTADVIRASVMRPLKKVELVMRCNESQLGRNWWLKKRVEKAIVRMVERVTINDLRLTCIESRKHECVLHDATFFDMLGEAVQRSGYTLKSVSVEAAMYDHDLKEMLESFCRVPTKRTYSVFAEEGCSLPRELTSILRKFDAVHIFCDSSELEFVTEVGDKVTILELNARYPSELDEGLSRLKHCTRLEELDIDLDQSEELSWSEHGLLQAVRMQHDLRALNIAWPCLTTTNVMRVLEGEGYHEAQPGLLLELVRSVPNLQELGLFGTRIAIEEWEEILKFLGDRLRVVGAGLIDQTECVMERLEDLLWLVWKHNKGIEEFYVEGPNEVVVDNMTDQEVWECVERMERIEVLRERINRRKPAIQMEEVERLVEGLEMTERLAEKMRGVKEGGGDATKNVWTDKWRTRQIRTGIVGPKED